ncbi:MAG: sugar phosphate isomerase/epimerase [Candidatus Obscuribacterales bacterium]|nr:sugar phosphate isomerase/epimerase [Candidatus Obscuribacterales bacterium]
MRLCFDATRFGCGLDGAIDLAAQRGLTAVEYSFAPFAISGKNGGLLDAKERKNLEGIAELSRDSGVALVVLNLDFCLEPLDKKSVKQFGPMLLKVMHVAKVVGCKQVSFSVAPGFSQGWKDLVVSNVQQIQETFDDDSVGLLLRLATPSLFRNQSLKSWTAMEPQDWRDLVTSCPNLGLSFSPADCVWLGIDYLRVLAGLTPAIDHIEAHDVEISRDLLVDSGMYGPLWWRYRMAGKGQVDWRQFIEALKLYDFQGTVSIHMDDEFVADETEELDNALTTSMKFIQPLLRG